jgi:hypothetical protein
MADKCQHTGKVSDESATDNLSADDIEMADIDVPDAIDPPEPEYDPPR